MKKMGNLGNYLRDRRIQKGISMDYAVRQTSLNENILNAIENSEYNFFNGYFYFSNFLNEYVEFLELNKEDVQFEFSKELSILRDRWKNDNTIPMNGLRYSNFKNKKILIRGFFLIVLIAIILYFLLENTNIISSILSKNDSGQSISMISASYSTKHFKLINSDFIWKK